jgi:hypothetical protein
MTVNKFGRLEHQPNIQTLPGTLANRCMWAVERGMAPERLKAPLLEIAYGDVAKGLLALESLIGTHTVHPELAVSDWYTGTEPE